MQWTSRELTPQRKNWLLASFEAPIFFKKKPSAKRRAQAMYTTLSMILLPNPLQFVYARRGSGSD